MNAPRPAADDGIRHYRFLAGLSLGILFILQQQMPHSAPTVQAAMGALMLLVGTYGLVTLRAVSPLLVLLPLAASLLVQRAQQGNWLGPPSAPIFLTPLDLALCMATLGYLAGHYRLLALRLESPTAPHRVVTANEFVGFLLQLPLFALLAQAVWYWVVAQPREQALWPTEDSWAGRWYLLTLAWTLAALLFAARLAFRYRHWRRLDQASARLLLQDVLWRETRGEQRRLQRWLAWRKRKG
jgi:hypothetical protein